MGYLEFGNGKKGCGLHLSKLRCSLEVFQGCTDGNILTPLWISRNFLIPIYLCYSLCRMYFSFQVHSCLFFGNCISGTEYPWYVVISKILGFELWACRTFSIFLTFTQEIRKSDKLPLVRTENLNKYGDFCKEDWSNISLNFFLCVNLKLTLCKSQSEENVS